MNDNEFLILLQAKLDEAKSKGNINSDIKKIQSQLDKLKIQTEIDRKTFSNFLKQLEEITNQEITISNLKIDNKQAITDAKQTREQISAILNHAFEDPIENTTSTLKSYSNLLPFNELSENGNTTTQIKLLRDNFTKLGLSADEVSLKMNTVDNEIATLKLLLNSDSDNPIITTQFNKLQLALKNTQNELESTRSEYSILITDQQRLAKADVIEAWNLKNKYATQDARNTNESYITSLRDLNTVMTKVQFNEISDGFSRVKNSMTALGKISTIIKGQFAQVTASITSFMSLSRIVMQTINWITKMPSTVTALDTALVDLKETANMSTKQLEEFYYSSNKIAKQMGVTTEDILKQASSWSRLGFNTAEAATEMAKLSSQFALISPGLSTDDATSGLASIMKAYDISVSDVLDGIESKINIIGNNLALSNANIVNMLQDSVSAMAEGRNSLEETIALEAAAYEITQDESVGNGFKTVALRLRGMNEETEELDESLKNIKGDLYELTGVSIMEDEGTYKSTYQILKEISEVWNSLTDTTRAEALELMFGKLRSNIGAAVLKNFSAAERAMELMANSAGSANAELSVAMDSIEYKMNQLGETGTSIAQNLFKRDDIKYVIDVLTSFMEVIDQVTEKLGLFGSIGLGTSLFAGFKNVGMA